MLQSLYITKFKIAAVNGSIYEFKEPILYDFVQSDFEDFEDFLDYIQDFFNEDDD